MNLLISVALMLTFLVALPVSTSTFLHGTGPNANPPTLFLDSSSPTNATAKYRDSAGVNFSGGNQWKEIGTWTMTQSGTLSQLRPSCVAWPEE